MIGWICLSRKIMECYLWKEKPFSKAQAWIDLLLLASHEKKKFLLGNELIEIERGSFVTSELKLMQRWGWGKSKTRAFLLLLENDGMIIKNSDRKKTTINIVNYNKYQDMQTTDRPQADHSQTDSRPIADTINNDNNANNDNNKKRAVFKPPSAEEVRAYCQERNNNINAESFIAFYESKGWMVGKNKMKDWKACIRTWEQRDNKPKQAQTTKFTNFKERDYDFSELEKKFARN